MPQTDGSRRKEEDIMNKIEELKEEMLRFYSGHPKQIQHFLKVCTFAEWIGTGEQLEEHTLFLLKAAALVHDIGIRPAMEKYGKSSGSLQEQEGPSKAREMLEGLGYRKEDIERICYLVGHHHTYTDVDGMDYRILLEADFLVNGYEEDMKKEAICHGMKTIFRTKTGIRILKTMFAV